MVAAYGYREVETISTVKSVFLQWLANLMIITIIIKLGIFCITFCITR